MQLLQMANHLVLTDMNKTSLLVNIRTMVEVFGESIFVRCTIAEKWQMRIQTIENGKNVSPWKSRRDNVKETKLRAPYVLTSDTTVSVEDLHYVSLNEILKWNVFHVLSNFIWMIFLS